jgi:hypothetical protein
LCPTRVCHQAARSDIIVSHKVTLWYQLIPQHAARREIQWIVPHPCMSPGRALRHHTVVSHKVPLWYAWLSYTPRPGKSSRALGYHNPRLQVHHKVYRDRMARTILRKIRYRYNVPYAWDRYGTVQVLTVADTAAAAIGAATPQCKTNHKSCPQRKTL